MGEVLVIEDEMVLARSIVSYLERRGFSADYAVDAASAKVQCEREAPRLVILDYKLNEDDGLVLLDWFKANCPEAQVIMMTGHGDVDIAVRAMKAGARDFLVKPAPLSAVASIAQGLMLDERMGGLDCFGADRIIGRSSAANALRRAVTRLGRGSGPGPRPGVLVVGPPGSGKFLIAQALHETATGSSERMTVLDCALESDEIHRCLADITGPCTLVLRGVSHLGMDAQSMLLRLLNRLDPQPSLIATTETYLTPSTGAGGILPQLLYSIQVGWIDVPSLSDRAADVLLIAEHVANRVARAAGQPRPKFTPAARVKLLEHEWTGNVAELVNCIERAMLEQTDGVIEGSHIRLIDQSADDRLSVPTLKELELSAIRQALHCSKGNVSQAANMLGISRDTLRYRMRKFDLEAH